MPTAQTGSKKKTASARRTAAKKAGGGDAIALLTADHREVEKYFADFEKARTDKRKGELAAKICLALKVHTQIEEESFYPTSRQYLDDEDIVDEAVVEHASAKELIAQIEAMEPGDELYDAKVKVLSEMIEHHVKEEEKEYFPQVKKTDMDLQAIGAQMAARKKELMAELSAPMSH
jgi:hemerythrin superfamily protein